MLHTVKQIYLCTVSFSYINSVGYKKYPFTIQTRTTQNANSVLLIEKPVVLVYEITYEFWYSFIWTTRY